MATLKRNPGTWILILLLGAGFFLLRENRSSGAPPPPPTGVCPDCNFATTDTIDSSTSINCPPPAVCSFHYPGNLTMLSGGKITCNDPASPTTASGCDITLIVDGNLTMNAGSQINADNQVDGGHGGTISIKVCGDVTMQGTTGGTAGAIISSQHLGSGTDNGGQITVVAGCVTFDVDGNPICGQPLGNITVGTGAKITANSNTHRGGDIALYAGHNILIQGSVTSQGTGGTGHGGKITIDACCDLKVDDTGLVSSRGLDPGADRVHLQGCTVEVFGLVESTGPGHQGPTPGCTTDRPNKNPNASACVEIWAGTTLMIDATGTHHGQVNADVGQSGGTSGRGWIDALANGAITVTGNTATPYNDPPPATGDLDNNHRTLPAWALHANMVLQNGFGGDISVLSRSDQITSSGRAIQANASTGSNGGQGGHVRVFALGNIALGNSSIQAMGDTTGGTPAGGTIAVHAVGAASTVTGSGPPGQLDAAGPGGSISVRGCGSPAPNPPSGAGEHADIVADQDVAVTCPDVVVFDPPADGPTFPSANCATNCQQITPTPTPTPTTTAPSITATVTPTPGGPCNKSEVIGALAGHIPDKVIQLDLPNAETIQHAVDTASDTNHDGFVIVLVVKDGTGQLGGHTTQRVTINRNDYGHPFQLFGCSVTMHDPDLHDGLPTGWITAGAGGANTIFIMDLHGADSDVAGWKVDGNGRTVRNTGGSGSPVGIWFNGNNNIMHNGAGSGNGIGLRIDGNGNLATDTDVFSNTSHGVQVTGNNNQLLKIDAGDLGKGNGGDGINVNGTGNLVQECDAYANTGNGIVVNSAGANTVKKSNGGARGKGNGQKGFVLGGSGPVTQNTAKGNTNYGFDISATPPGHTLTSNVSGGTGSGEPNGPNPGVPCQYFVAGSNTNVPGNKSNGVTVVGNPFPTGCN